VAHPGRRFLSARAVAQRFAVSYQTAHRLLAELQTEGLLRREAASGSYVPGRHTTLRGVQLVFHRRARRKGSFGAHLLAQLETTLKTRGIPVVRCWPEGGTAPRLRSDFLSVIWECRAAAQSAAAARRFAVCLNDLPPPGLGGGYVDAVTTDDFSGGACAAELLKVRTGQTRGFVVLGGPTGDLRSERRIAGFRAHVSSARVVCADSWFLEAGRARAAEVLRGPPAGIFACNDRLAEAVLLTCRDLRRPLPPLVGFDNAPIAEHLRLTTVGIPWHSMVNHAVSLISDRLRGSTEPARLVSLAHEPVVRLTC
jgi:DNA-binding transcriptional regulator YhcF (GntR family)